jgi:hypothetical protein
MYIENPKTKGSGILCAIPQTGVCPNNCEDCFFQSGRSYLEPLFDNLPNMPPKNTTAIIRVNDGHDSNVQKKLVLDATENYQHKFYNTAIPNLDFPIVTCRTWSGHDETVDYAQAPVVLTLNPGKMTDVDFHKVDVPPNLMFVRFRTNLWNLDLCDRAVEYYTHRDVPVPVVLTFMAYHKTPEAILKGYPDEVVMGYIFRKRTLNEYWAITTDAWRKSMARYEDNPLVYSCGKIEGEKGKSGCKYCGNCVREYHNTMERLRPEAV